MVIEGSALRKSFAEDILAGTGLQYAKGHSFGESLKCLYCSVTWQQHQQTGVACESDKRAGFTAGWGRKRRRGTGVVGASRPGANCEVRAGV